MTAQALSRAETRRIVYNDWIVRWFVAASIGWAIVALLLGAIVALQLAFWPANVAPWFSYGRLRPLHTNAAIFAFVGNMIFAGVYHSTQRLVKARLPSDLLAKIHFWGWQGIIVAAAITLPLGLNQAKEYAELEWPIDIAIAAVWIVFAVQFFWTLWRRAEKHLYVAIWFYIATIITVAVLHVFNALAIPISPLKSYSIFGGAKDALVQWWYGHNAVAFFLTTPILGIMYYYLPKAADRPVYSYRLSIVHFWSLIFVYIWAGPHHLLNTALPDWAQTLGMIFSIMLWAPSWGGMLNGLLTLRGGWSQVRSDPVLKFFAAGVTFYGMATFEGPLLSIKSVSALAHYTDWIVGHVHAGALGWNGFMAAGMFYWLVPRLYGRELYSKRMADLHFSIGTVGILLYVASMWVSGISQGMMWKAMNEDGGLLYPSFVETLLAIRPMYFTRLVGGTLYLVGMCMMAYNLWKTVRGAVPVEAAAEVVVEVESRPQVSWGRLVFGKPVIVSVVVVGLSAASALGGAFGVVLLALAAAIGVTAGVLAKKAKKEGEPAWHGLLEGRALLFTVLTTVAVLAGGVAQILPMALAPRATASATKPYAPLELEGRDIYIREGCYTCHSQMIRPFRWETMRYGEVSTLEDSAWDHPFQWGSKRTGPDLAREGGKYPNLWHYRHFLDPRSVSPGSNMPSYAWLAEGKVDFDATESKVRAMRSIGVPYSVEDIHKAGEDARAHAEMIAADLAANGAKVDADTEMVALIAYMQRLGQPESPYQRAESKPQQVSSR